MKKLLKKRDAGEQNLDRQTTRLDFIIGIVNMS